MSNELDVLRQLDAEEDAAGVGATMLELAAWLTAAPGRSMRLRRIVSPRGGSWRLSVRTEGGRIDVTSGSLGRCLSVALEDAHALERGSSSAPRQNARFPGGSAAETGSRPDPVSAAGNRSRSEPILGALANDTERGGDAA